MQTVREALIVRAVTDEAEGWGEGVAMNDPLYSSEYVEASVDVITRFLLPALAQVKDLHAGGVAPALAKFKGHRMSKAAVELAILDAELRATGVPLSRELGAVRDRVDCGVSVGIMDSIPSSSTPSTLPRRGLRAHQAQDRAGVGHRSRPCRARAVRDDVLLQVDANTAYHRGDARHLAKLDPFDLLLIEQPLDEEDLLGHAQLAKAITTTSPSVSTSRSSRPVPPPTPSRWVPVRS